MSKIFGEEFLESVEVPLYGGTGDPAPMDHLRAPFGEKRVAMILDYSGSMGGGVLIIPG